MSERLNTGVSVFSTKCWHRHGI